MLSQSKNIQTIPAPSLMNESMPHMENTSETIQNMWTAPHKIVLVEPRQKMLSTKLLHPHSEILSVWTSKNCSVSTVEETLADLVTEIVSAECQRFLSVSIRPCVVTARKGEAVWK